MLRPLMDSVSTDELFGEKQVVHLFCDYLQTSSPLFSQISDRW